MAETVQYRLERMIPELEELERKGLFNKVKTQHFFQHDRATLKFVCILIVY
ncbi:hypothetical protein BDA99DRAFT_501694, partial [Phascolomyces articulosus]